MNEKAVPVASALATVIEHAAEAYGEERGRDFVDPTARAWIWKNDALDYYPFERRGRGQSMWLKDALNEARRLPNVVKCIEYETCGLR